MVFCVHCCCSALFSETEWYSIQQLFLSCTVYMSNTTFSENCIHMYIFYHPIAPYMILN